MSINVYDLCWYAFFMDDNAWRFCNNKSASHEVSGNFPTIDHLIFGATTATRIGV